MRFWLRLGKWTRRGLIALAILVAVATPAVTLGVLSYKGFCFDQRRFLSDEEAFTAVIQEIILRSSHVRVILRPEMVQFRPVKVIRYRDVNEFREWNPDCCKVVPHNMGEGPYASFSQRLFGYASRTVSVDYLVRYVGEDGSERIDDTTKKYVVTNCGRAWRATR
jgi:hypothetical protein